MYQQATAMSSSPFAPNGGSLPIKVLHIPIKMASDVGGSSAGPPCFARRMARRRKSETLPENDMYYNKRRGKIVTETTTEFKEVFDDSDFAAFGASIPSLARSSLLESQISEEGCIVPKDKPRAASPPVCTKGMVAPRSRSSSGSDSDAGGDDGVFRQQALDAHNEMRRKHGVKPLTLDEKLCSFAQSWANKLASEDSFQHRPDNDFGENLYCFYASNPNAVVTGEQVTSSWYSEVSKYQFGSEPRSTGAGHFTQVVWKDSESMGIARARTSKGKYIVVANYDPPGNIIGSYTQNVMPPKPC